MKRFRIEERVEVLRVYDIVAADRDSAQKKITEGSASPIEVKDLESEMTFIESARK